MTILLRKLLCKAGLCKAAKQVSVQQMPFFHRRCYWKEVIPGTFLHSDIHTKICYFFPLNFIWALPSWIHKNKPNLLWHKHFSPLQKLKTVVTQSQINPNIFQLFFPLQALGVWSWGWDPGTLEVGRRGWLEMPVRPYPFLWASGFWGHPCLPSIALKSACLWLVNS